MSLILASTSRYRAELLARLRIPFQTIRPDVNETPLAHEAPLALAKRLARAKAAVVATQHPQAMVIGSDQVADLGGNCIGKPIDRSAAVAGLLAASSQSVWFHSAVCVIGSQGQEPRAVHEFVVSTRCQFRALTRQDAEAYVRAEESLDCAGGFKSEGLGIALFDSLESSDPTALIGLPLIELAKSLRRLGLAIP